jgi:ActR/RegA family two-component response regulator
MNHKSNPIARDIDLDRLVQRLDSIRQALGAARLGVARRLSRAGEADRVYEVLAASGEGTSRDAPERSISLSVLEEVMRLGTPCAISADRGRPAWSRRLRRWGCWRIEAWPFPADRLPSVFFVAHFDGPVDPGDRRRLVARAGMDALARALAPPTWAPLAQQKVRPSSRPPGGSVTSLRDAVQRFECSLIERALADADGNKSEAARQLRMSRQGLYRKLRAHGLLDEERPHELDTGPGST